MNDTNKNPSMKYHTSYYYSLFVTAFILSAILIGTITGSIASVALLLPIAYCVTTGILLLKKTKVGFILNRILNIASIITNAVSSILCAGLVLIFGILSSIVTNSDFADYSNLLSIILSVGTTTVLIVAIILFVINIASVISNVYTIKYYSKRKELFTEKI